MSATSWAVARDGARGAAEGVLVSAARAAWLSSHWVVVLNWHHTWAGLQTGGVIHRDQWVKKALVGARELVVAYITLLHGRFNI